MTKSTKPDPEVAYAILLACKKTGQITEKGSWVINRVEQLKKRGVLNSVEIAMLEAAELWQGFDCNSKMSEV